MLRMSTPALFVIAKGWKQVQCSINHGSSYNGMKGNHNKKKKIDLHVLPILYCLTYAK